MREFLQTASIISAILVMGLICVRLYRHEGNWRVWLPMIINMILTVLYYGVVFTSPNLGTLGDFSAALRLETILTFLAYVLYMPRGFRRNV